MERCKIGTQAGGVAGMKSICDLLSIGVDPITEFTEYSEVIGTDLNDAPIEAGFPRATWEWRVMPQSDFEHLNDFISSTGSNPVYICTRKNTGASGYDFANYLAVMRRPKTSGREGLLVRAVVLEFTMLVAV